MALSQRLQVRQAQSLAMTPQLQQAIKLLQMSNLELSAFVEQQIAENPLLEARPSDSDSVLESAPEPADPQMQSRDAADVVSGDDGFGQQLEAADTDFTNEWDLGSAADGASGTGDGLLWGQGGGAAGWEDGPGWEAFAESPVSLREHLEAQIGEEFADPIIRRVATLIADNLDEAGYFRGDVSEMAYVLGVSRETVAAVHQQFLQFDPPGIGACSVRECLSVQLADMGVLDTAMSCLLDHLDLIAKGDFQRLARLCGTDLGGLQEMMAKLRQCAPRPAAGYDHTPVQTLVPDVLISQAEHGGWNVELNPEALPQVLVNRSYYASVRQQTRGKSGTEFVTELWQNANWLAKALDQRANTILKTAVAIVEQQDAFFAEGVSGLRPMTLKDVAAKIGMHESTVSRVTNGKYAATPRGVLELKFFFSNAVGTASGDDATSAEAVRHRLKQMIDGETVKNVLSDEKLVEMLGDEGIAVARRTVAKYREGMKIPSSAKRRRLLKLTAG